MPWPWRPWPAPRPPSGRGQILANGFNQPAVPPDYTRAAAAALNDAHPGTRLYAIPGNNFGAQRWGDTIDTVYPGLMTRPFITHEQQIMGSLPTADVLEAVDGPLQDGVMDWDALGPMASLLERGRRPRPVRPGLRALRHPQPADGGRPVRHAPGRTRRPGPLRHAPAQRARPPPLRRGHPGAAGQPGLADAPRLLHGDQSRGPSSAPSRRPPRWSWRATPTGWSAAASVGPPARQPDHPLRGHARHRRASCARPRCPAGRPGGHRHQPQAGLPVELAQREHRLHRDRGPGPGHGRPERRAPRPLPGGAGRRPDDHGARRGLDR